MNKNVTKTNVVSDEISFEEMMESAAESGGSDINSSEPLAFVSPMFV